MKSWAIRKTRISLLLAVVISALLTTTSASAADKYVSPDFGFAAAYPGSVVRSQVSSDVATFIASAPGDAWVAQVKVTQNVVMPQDITKDFMDAKLAEVLKANGMTQTGASSYGRLHGNRVVLARATFYINNADTNYVTYPVVADMKLIFVTGQSLVTGQNRLYFVAGWAIQGKDRTGIQPFLDSFELR